MKATTAVRSNPIPQGGVGALQPTPPISTPQDIARLVDEMTRAISAFRAASTPQEVPLDNVTFANSELGQSKDTDLKKVGLGYAIASFHTVVINLANSNAAPQSVSFSPHFPYNLITSTSVSLNGGETPYSCSGRAGLMVWGRDRRTFFQPQPGAAGLNAGVCSVTAGANLTLTAAAASAMSFSGQASVSVAANQNGNLTCKFATYEKLAHGRDTLIGALPLQNSQTYATISMQIVGALLSATNQQTAAPLFNAGANITASLTSWTTKRRYLYWGIPSDPGVYQDLIRNSYQVIEQSGLSTNSTGSEAITYNIPSNLYLEALHFSGSDGNGAFLTTNTALTKELLSYNAGALNPVRSDPDVKRARQVADYGADIMSIPGYWLWDGDNTTDSLTITDDAGWVDTYAAAEPAWVFDVVGTAATPIKFSVTRECLVAGSVQQVGG